MGTYKSKEESEDYPMHDTMLAGMNNLSMSESIRLATMGDTKTRCKLASNPSCPQVIQLGLLCDKNIDVRCSLATNPNISRIALEELIQDPSLTVRFWLSGIMNLGPDLLLKLMNDENAYVAERARATYETVLLEQELRELEINTPDEFESPKLGELLVMADLLDEVTRDKLLQESKRKNVPLGQIIVTRRCLPRALVLESLRVQKWLRGGTCDLIYAIEHLTRAARICSPSIFAPSHKCA